MVMRLATDQLAALAAGGAVRVPSYDRGALAPGIVHLGLGAFHRAHQAVYTEAVLAAGDLRWGIIGVSLRHGDARAALAPQDHLYTVAVRDAGGERLQVIGALMASLVAPDQPAAVLAAMADPRCHIVSMSVTEKGYCHDPASGTLQLHHPDIVHDLAHPHAPRSALGFIVRALALRRAGGVAPFTVLSCDNLPSNGITTRALVLALAHAIEPALATWIANEGAFPNTMVDRIVPATTDNDRAHVARLLGVADAWPVMTEAFSEWVIEDDFAGPRPAWEDAGVTIVRQAAPYEQAKLRMLNASHSTLAYLGTLLGHATVDQAMADPDLAGFVQRMLIEEVEPTLTRPRLAAYRADLLQRFRNPALRHQLHQIAMDGSQKLPQRLLGTIRDRLAVGASCDCLCLAVAGWARYLAGRDQNGGRYALSDPLAERLQQAARGADADATVAALLAIEAVFGTDLPRQPLFVKMLTRQLRRIDSDGLAAAMQMAEGVPCR
jgi:fructuronate reductase